MIYQVCDRMSQRINNSERTCRIVVYYFLEKIRIHQLMAADTDYQMLFL